MPLPLIFRRALSGLLTKRQKWCVGIIHWTNASIVSSFLITLQWVGWWNILAYNIWPDSWAAVRDTIYILIGCIMLFVAEKWIPLSTIESEMEEAWRYSVPLTFDIYRKLSNYAKSYLHFMAFVVFWVGAWTLFDEYFEQSLYRDVIYLLLPLPLLYLSQEVFSRESLCWMFLKYNTWSKTTYEYLDTNENKEATRVISPDAQKFPFQSS